MQPNERELLERLSTELDSLSAELVEALIHMDALNETQPLPDHLREAFAQALRAASGAVDAIQQMELAELERLAS